MASFRSHRHGGVSVSNCLVKWSRSDFEVNIRSEIHSLMTDLEELHDNRDRLVALRRRVIDLEGAHFVWAFSLMVGVGGSPRVPLSGIPGEEDQSTLVCFELLVNPNRDSLRAVTVPLSPGEKPILERTAPCFVSPIVDGTYDWKAAMERKVQVGGMVITKVYADGYIADSDMLHVDIGEGDGEEHVGSSSKAASQAIQATATLDPPKASGVPPKASGDVHIVHVIIKLKFHQKFNMRMLPYVKLSQDEKKLESECEIGKGISKDVSKFVLREYGEDCLYGFDSFDEKPMSVTLIC
ncbi:hypothetical protein L1987_18929 [Smallanthus sonchifolius]|uniref:Uncharacterized protein n=1 Tax=Smallanthus sonchifolius TaxID=185202 RepID=A0ACB9J358_9ASTR|nr:hypothetical protein L1987_18929 [Smallanthus sonchifolius]